MTPIKPASSQKEEVFCFWEEKVEEEMTRAVIEIKPSFLSLPIVRILVNHDGIPKRQVPFLQRVVADRSLNEDEESLRADGFTEFGEFAAELIVAYRTNFGDSPPKRESFGAEIAIVCPNQVRFIDRDYYYQLWPDKKGKFMVRIESMWDDGPEMWMGPLRAWRLK